MRYIIVFLFICVFILKVTVCDDDFKASSESAVVHRYSKQTCKTKLSACTINPGSFLKGERGSPGLQGPVGPKGENGEPGFNGTIGQKGPKGDRGEPGVNGITGEQGRKGEMGNPGANGTIGEKGLKGDRGPKGEQGVPGTNGRNGEKGDRGEPGINGMTGESGATGARGEPGIKGMQGEKGSPGDQGVPGFKGESGENGVTGPQGPIGLKGDKGILGSDGKNGEKGDRGDRGYPGYPGIPGSNGVCECSDLEDTDLYGPGEDRRTDESKKTAFTTCNTAPDGTEDGDYDIRPASPFQVHCNMTEKRTCVILNETETSTIEANAIKHGDEPFWLSSRGVNWNKLYGDLRVDQVEYLHQQSVTIKQTIRYHCKNSMVDPSEEKSLLLMTWKEKVIRPHPTEDTPFFYTIQNDGCKDSAVHPDEWLYTDIVLVSNFKGLPIVDFYIRDIRSGVQQFYIEMVDLCFG